ncbi:adenylate/guanylate cyclase domain-containing protein [Mycobacterium sp. 1274761.0]|uniref:adenylate/guanylate cyclase domain-containing protein n=1 Tax=Mycobacterium sp. 1274761.0 TaxID=1834077 RepID=UPI0007FCE1B3|nr:adenylate/guanylate cyclase domain-containing protein [Mycobacterium sp. 1274761.0]OBK72745.1 cyclase [Mycobacterium sp. 1274761.0]
MERIYQWAWDRYAAKYSWAVYVVSIPVSLPAYVFWSFLILAVEGSDHYVEAAAITVPAVVAMGYAVQLPGLGRGRLVQEWAAGRWLDRAGAMEATYAWTRAAIARAAVLNAVWGGLVSAVIAAIAGATESRIVQYGILGVGVGAASGLIAMHSLAEATARPARLAIAGHTAVGDSLPRSRPTFAARSTVFVLANIFIFAIEGAMLATALDRFDAKPLLFLVIGSALMVVVGIPLSVGLTFAPALRPIRDLAAGTDRVAAGDYGHRVPVVQDDDLGALSASFNRMQAGLAERQRLQAAFGTYVDPALAARLLEQGDDVFTGERREVTVMFVDIRDFTPFAEANSAEDTVARLNALFDIVVPAVVEAGGHVNKFLGDGALAVFGAPNDLGAHADAAVSAAIVIHRRVGERFGGGLRIGIGINTGVVIAGTIGGAGKLEFTLIGDTVNVAARVEQLTKTTGDSILLTQQTVDALSSRPAAIADRGPHALKGKAAPTRIFSLDLAATPRERALDPPDPLIR